MSTAPAIPGGGGIYSSAEKSNMGRRSGGPVLSASRRNVPVPGNSRVGPPGGIPGAATVNSKNMVLPPLQETSFSEQYKTFKALGGQ